MHIGIKLILFFILFSFLNNSLSGRERLKFEAAFQPVQGMVKEVERDYREEICLNGSWLFMPIYEATKDDFKLPAKYEWEETTIKIPSPWDINNYTKRYGEGGDFVAYPSYPEKWIKAKIGWMKKDVEIPQKWDGRTIKLHFEGVFGKTMVYVNGQKVIENFEFFMPFDAEITQYLIPGKKNEILVGVARGALFDIPGKNGHRPYVSGSFYGTDVSGIWQDVYLFAYPEVYVEDVFIQPFVSKNTLKVEVEIRNTTNKKQIVNIGANVREWINRAGRSIVELPEEKWDLADNIALDLNEIKNIQLNPNSSLKVALTGKVDSKLKLWSPKSPNLYGMLIQLSTSQKVFDIKYERFGWREFSIKGKDFFLNDEKIELRGESWHFMGVPQMTRRYAWALYDMLKAANANAVRFHAQPYPRFYMELADEMGICVLDETAIWASDGGPKIDDQQYWDLCEEHLRKLIKRDKNYPSVFGWSVCNETIPVCLYVYRTTDDLLNRQIKEINNWTKITKEMDPTRNWISGDGETERKTDLPTNMGHYGDKQTIEYWASLPLPWGIGEQGMAYYATPKQVSKMNGNRAYESALGRMEGIAQEAYDLIKKQRELNASYSCVFNLAWYALEPLPFGMKNINEKFTLEDGVFFNFKEGQPGMQPERLGPYTTVFNPGFDNSLPLYKTWPLFDAVKAAFATPIEAYSLPENVSENKSYPKIERQTLFIGKDKSELRNILDKLGVNIVSSSNKLKEALVLVDGKEASLTDEQQKLLEEAISSGATIFVVGVGVESLDLLNRYLPHSLTLEPREATSFLKKADVPLLESLNHADFYFTELLGGYSLDAKSKNKGMIYGLSGEFVTNAKVLVEACQADWGKWVYSQVPTKTAAIIRSERETKGAKSAIVSYPNKGGEIIVSSIDFGMLGNDAESLFRCLLSNLGGTFSNEKMSSTKAISPEGFLQNALICGAFNEIGKSIHEMADADYLGNIAAINPQLGDRSKDKFWNLISANDNNTLELRSARISGSNENAAIYLSFWFYSPRSLSDLLIEPDMPILNLSVRTHVETRVFLNGKSLENIKSIDKEGVAIFGGIPADKGWNHFMVKITRGPGEGGWDANIKFDCRNNKDYMKNIMSSVVR